MIKVCDAIMGSGKSSSCINYMNEHPERRYIYITPYLDEAARIKNACPALHFVEPEEKWSYVPDQEDDEMLTQSNVMKRTKVMHTAVLIQQGRNIATTHQAFLYYTQEMIENIRKWHYTLIIDEDLQAINQFKLSLSDLEIIKSAGYVEEHGGVYSLSEKKYEGGRLGGLFRILQSRDIIRSGRSTIFWILHSNILAAFDDIFILTYLFDGQALSNLLRIEKMPYEFIGIRHDETGYHFDANHTSIPEYAAHLSELIHICDNKKMNAIGDGRTDLSANWFTKPTSDTDLLRRHMSNWFRNIRPTDDPRDRLWTTYKKRIKVVKDRGYAKRFVVLNKKATNDYANCYVLAYAANVFMHPDFRNYYVKKGVDPNEDLYALSTMIQWIWRSAIRNGGEIWIYIPSKRMRNLLKDWIQNVEQEARRIYGEEHEQLSA